MRDLDNLRADHPDFLEKGGGDKSTKLYNNVIDDLIFNSPLTHVQQHMNTKHAVVFTFIGMHAWAPHLLGGFLGTPWSYTQLDLRLAKEHLCARR